MAVDPKSIDALRSARRIDIKSKVAFYGGFYAEIGPAVLGGNEAVPDMRLNRISVLEPDRFDQALLTECADRMIEGAPLFIDVPHPASERLRELLLQNGYHPTGESRSSMVLADYGNVHQRTHELDIAILEPDAVALFLDLILRAVDTPENRIHLVRGLLHDLVLQNLHRGRSRLYLGIFKGEPAATLYLFHEGREGCIDLVSTREKLRGRGFATAIVQRAIDDSQELGLRVLSLETESDSTLEHLCRRLGFTTVARHEIFTNIPGLRYGS